LGYSLNTVIQEKAIAFLSGQLQMIARHRPKPTANKPDNQTQTKTPIQTPHIGAPPQALLNSNALPGLTDAADASDTITDLDVIAATAATAALKPAGAAAVMIRAAHTREAAKQLLGGVTSDAGDDASLGGGQQVAGGDEKSEGRRAAGAAAAAVPLPVAAAEVVVQGGDNDWEAAVAWGEPSAAGQRGDGGVATAAAATASTAGARARGVDVMGLDGGVAPGSSRLGEEAGQHLPTLTAASPATAPLRRLALPSNVGAAGGALLGRLSRPRRPPTFRMPPVHPRMLRLAPQPHPSAAAAAAAAQRKGKGKGGKDGGGAAAAAGNQDGGQLPRPSARPAAAAPQLLHAGSLLARRFQSGLDDDEWVADVIWEVHAPDAAPGTSQPTPGTPQSALAALIAGGGAAAPGRRRVAPLLWDLNDGGMVFECDAAGAYDDAEALVRAPPPRVRFFMFLGGWEGWGWGWGARGGVEV